MPYSIPLSKISIGEYKTLLKAQSLLPSRQILMENIDANFVAIEKQGISDLAELKKALGNPKKVADFSAISGISAAYLTILRREMGSLEPNPVKISDFPEVDSALIASLQKLGISTAKDVFENDQSLDIELRCLCDLTRINGVGAIAARMFYDAGYHSPKDIANAKPKEMLEKINTVNADKQFYKASLGEKDMQFCIDAATLLIRYT